MMMTKNILTKMDILTILCVFEHSSAISHERELNLALHAV